MSDVLSQNEIDSLLSAIELGDFTGGGESTTATQDEQDTSAHKEMPWKRPASVKIYDFKRPDKFSKDQMRTIQMIHDTYARLTTTSLSAQLRSFVNVHVVSVDQLTYEEFSRSIPNPTTLAIINMDPLNGSAIMEIDPTITFTIVDRLFGGGGETMKENRELTDIELSVIEGIGIRILGNLREAWSNVLDLRPKLGTIETNIQFAQIVPPNDMVVLITLETRIGEVEGMMNFCIPYITIEPIVSKLSAQYWYSSIRKGTNQENIELLKDQIFDTSLNISAKLGKISLSMRDLLQIKAGDVIRLDTKINSNLDVIVGTKKKYTCRPGTIGKKLGIQITSISNDVGENEEIEEKEEEYG